MNPSTKSLAILLELPAGTLIGPYRLEELLSSTTFGVVYRATRDGRNFTLKLPLANIIRPLPKEPRLIEAAITREVLALMSLQHPGVASVEGFGRWPDATSDLLYVAMELPPGMPLTTWRQTSAGSLREIVEVFRLLGLSLHALHSKGLVHRDIKSAAVYVAPGADVPWQPVLLDFGIGRPVHTPGPTAEQLRLNLTGRWAPELFTAGADEDTKYTPASDLFALGHLFYEALTGRAPIHCDENGVMCATGDRVLAPSVVQLQLPPELDAPVLRLLAKRPEERTPSALAFAEELGRIQALLTARHTLLAMMTHTGFQQRKPEVDAALKRLIADFAPGGSAALAALSANPEPTPPRAGATPECPPGSLFVLEAKAPDAPTNPARPPTSFYILDAEAPDEPAEAEHPAVPLFVLEPVDLTHTRAAPPSRPRRLKLVAACETVGRWAGALVISCAVWSVVLMGMNLVLGPVEASTLREWNVDAALESASDGGVAPVSAPMPSRSLPSEPPTKGGT